MNTNYSNYIRLLRPDQWVKNGFVFMPMFFAGQLANPFDWKNCIIGFLVFSLAASGIYCLNDIKDVEEDRLHPRKRRRPVADGKVSVTQAYNAMTLLLVASVALCLLLQDEALFGLVIIGSYIFLDVLYCLWLKKMVIVDIFIISAGYILRILWGGVTCDIWLSPWIILLTGLLALFLAVGKRRAEVELYKIRKVAARKNIAKYNLEFVNLMLGITGGITIVCYILYTVSPEVMERFQFRYLYISSIFIIGGIFRYLQLCIVENKGGNPTQIALHDKGILFCVVGMLLFFVVVIYG